MVTVHSHVVFISWLLSLVINRCTVTVVQQSVVGYHLLVLILVLVHVASFHVSLYCTTVLAKGFPNH